MSLHSNGRLITNAHGMKKKGRLSVGADAHLTIFDPGRIIIDRATIEQAACPSEGVQYVLVNGVLLVKEGKIQGGVAPGRPIRVEIH